MMMIHLLDPHVYVPLLCLPPVRVLALLGYQIIQFQLPRSCQLGPLVLYPASQDDGVLKPCHMPAGGIHLKQTGIKAPHQTHKFQCTP